MPVPQKVLDSKKCEVCGIKFNRTRYSSGLLETSTNYHGRKFCSKDCWIRGYGTLKDRLMKHIVKTDQDCWEWIGSRNGNGYGLIEHKRKTVATHRASYREFVGPIGNFHVLHECDNPPCINPAHLTLGTHKENMYDSIKKGRFKSVQENTCAH